MLFGFPLGRSKSSQENACTVDRRRRKNRIMSTTHIPLSRAPSGAPSSHVSAPTRFVEAGGVRYAYRRFGTEIGTPLVFLPHFRAGMDQWDPLVTDGLGANRPVILFDNAGVASSSGATPDTFEAQAEHLAIFVRGLVLQRFDVLGFSIGRYAAQPSPSP